VVFFSVGPLLCGLIVMVSLYLGKGPVHGYLRNVSVLVWHVVGFLLDWRVRCLCFLGVLFCILGSCFCFRLYIDPHSLVVVLV